MVIVFKSGKRVDVSSALPRDGNGELVSPSKNLRRALKTVAPEMLPEFDKQMRAKKKALRNMDKMILR